VTSYVIARTLGDPTASTSHKSSFVTDPSSKSELPPTATTTTATTTAIIIDKSDPFAPIIAPSYPTTLGDDDEGNAAVPTTMQGGAVSASPPPPPPPAPDVFVERPTPDSHTPTFFVEEDDGAARLAGVGVFSPVASLHGSPATSRRDLLQEGEKRGGEDDDDDEEEEEGVVTSGSENGMSVSLRMLRGLERVGGGARHEHEHEVSGGGEATCGSTSGESSFALLEREESFEDAGAHIRRRIPGTTGADD
jgi:hypothetical protein